MKNFLLVSIFIVLGISSMNAQNQTLSYSNTWFEYNGSDGDTIGYGDSVYTYTITKYTTNKVTPRLYVELDSIGGAAAEVTTYLQKKVSSDESWSNIDTVVYNGTVDTSYIMQPDNTQIGDYYRFYLQCENDGFNLKIKTINGKFVYE